MTAAVRTVHSYCRICQAHCGIKVDLDADEQIVRITGDPDHPVSRGYTCSKGRSLGRMHHSPGRLEQPLLRGVTVSWDEVMGDLAPSLGRLVDEHGPDSIACYRSTGWVLDSSGRAVADRWMRAVGTRQIYSPNTIDTPNRMLVPDLVTGAPFLQPVTDWDRAELLVLFGHNVVVSHGHATAVPDPVRRIRDLQARGGAVIVVDPRQTETARLADVHLQIAPGSDAALAAHLVRQRLRTRCDVEYLERCADLASVERLRAVVEPFDRDTVLRLCGLVGEDLDRAMALVEGAARLAYLSGTGVSMGPAPNATEWLGWALGAVTGSLDREHGMLFNPGVIRPQTTAGPATMPRVTGPPPSTRPDLAHAYGEYPSAILCDEILSGEVRALISFGGNVLASFPDTDKTLEALRSLEVLAVTELHHTQTTDVATHVLPTCGQLERHDLTFFLDQAFPIPFAQYTPPVVKPVGSRRSLWRVMLELGERMGLDLTAVAGIEDEEELVRSQTKRARVSFDDLKAAPSGIAPDVPQAGWLVPDLLPKGLLDLAPDLLVDELAGWALVAEASAASGGEVGALRLVCRRLPHQMNSDLQDIPVQLRDPHPTLLIHPSDADRLGVRAGTRVRVANGNGATEARAEVTERIRPGVVSLPHAWPDPAVNRLTNTDDLEPITGMPRFTSLSVSVAAVAG